MSRPHNKPDAVRFGRTYVDVAIQLRIITAQFLFRITGQGEDFFSPLFQE